MKILLSVCAIVFLFSIPGHAALYEWKDDKGVVNFTDNPENIPPKYLKRVKKRPSITGETEPAAPPAPARETKGAPAAAKAAPVQEKEITYGGHNEEWWRSSFSNLQDEINKIQEKLPQKKEDLIVARRKMTIYQAAHYRKEYYDLLADIGKDETRLNELQSQLQALDIEASRAGVPMEWRK